MIIIAIKRKKKIGDKVLKGFSKLGSFFKMGLIFEQKFSIYFAVFNVKQIQ